MRKHQINAETSKISNKHSKKKQMRKKKQKLNCSNFNPGEFPLAIRFKILISVTSSMHNFMIS